MNPHYQIEPLATRHDRTSFDCGEPSLTDFLKRYAHQNDERGLGRTFVAVLPDDPVIYGYYMLASSALQSETVLEKLACYPSLGVVGG